MLKLLNVNAAGWILKCCVEFEWDKMSEKNDIFWGGGEGEIESH